MSGPMSITRRYAASIAGLILVLSTYGATRWSVAPAPHLDKLAAHYKFEQFPMPEVPGQTYQTVRKVAPSLKRIDGWISAVGAAVAMGDRDGDGLSNDIVWVDARTDLVTVAPAPTTPARYAPFVLNASPLRYDATMAPMGALTADLNEDGLMDVLVIYW